MKKTLIGIIIFMLLSANMVFAEEKVETNPSVETKAETEADIDDSEDSDIVDALVGKLETILDPDSNELEEDINKTLEKHSENAIVKFFKKIMSVVKRLLDSILKLATDASKIEVE